MQRPDFCQHSRLRGARSAVPAQCRMLVPKTGGLIIVAFRWRFRSKLMPLLESFMSLCRMLLVALLPLLTLSAAASSAAEAPERLYEMRVYYAAEGKLDALHARFRNHTMNLFTKHGMENLLYSVPVGDNPERKLVFFLSSPDRPARDASWKAFSQDPAWQAAQAESELEGRLVAKAVETFLLPTDYSPASLVATAGAAPRVFELRSYTATPGNLPALNSRFRDHTLRLFAKHGMTNLIYWNLAPGQAGADSMLVYLLSHSSTEAAGNSFESFRKDPDWLLARAASEKQAGGSLTVATQGVVSEFLVPTDYSPLK